MAETRQKYLYERLGDHDFQQLVSALLSAQFAAYTAMALRQSAGFTLQGRLNSTSAYSTPITHLISSLGAQAHASWDS